MKRKENSIKRGQRLQTARKAAGLTQQELAEKANYGTCNYISMLETGRRVIDWDKAREFAKILNVSAAYLMGETDNMNGLKSWDDIGVDSSGNSDKLFLLFLQSQGVNISFICIYPLEERNDFIAGKKGDYEKIPRHEVPFNNIAFNLWDIYAFTVDETGRHETIIESVKVNQQIIPYGAFCQFISQIYDHILFDISKVDRFTRSADVYRYMIRDRVEGEAYYDFLLEMDLEEAAKYDDRLPDELEDESMGFPHSVLSDYTEEVKDNGEHTEEE